MLLDTHTFLWFISGNTALPADVRAIIEAPTTTSLLSIGSLWELAIKSSQGKLALGGLTISQLVDQHGEGNGIALLPATPTHLDRLLTLPYHHKDPFDRLLIAQALADQLIILGRDPLFDAYGVSRYW